MNQFRALLQIFCFSSFDLTQQQKSALLVDFLKAFESFQTANPSEGVVAHEKTIISLNNGISLHVVGSGRPFQTFSHCEYFTFDSQLIS